MQKFGDFGNLNKESFATTDTSMFKPDASCTDISFDESFSQSVSLVSQSSTCASSLTGSSASRTTKSSNNRGNNANNLKDFLSCDQSMPSLASYGSDSFAGLHMSQTSLMPVCELSSPVPSINNDFNKSFVSTASSLDAVIANSPMHKQRTSLQYFLNANKNKSQSSQQNKVIHCTLPKTHPWFATSNETHQMKRWTIAVPNGNNANNTSSSNSNIMESGNKNLPPALPRRTS